MIAMTMKEFESTINTWGQQQVPFLFIVDFEMLCPVAILLNEVREGEVLYDINGRSNAPQSSQSEKVIKLTPKPASFETYRNKFEKVFKHLERGDSYLANLTIRTEISVNAGLKELFYNSTAKYKLLLKDNLLVFSPEIFVQVKDKKIFSFPMKGTINASVPDAKEIILNDPKELAEHVTIVDLIRNDLSQVANNVSVTRFRYIDEIISSHQNRLLQVSSEVVGDLNDSCLNNLGTLLVTLLPAGSVTGAPKQKTVEIIRQAEDEERGYYTGVFGIFDGRVLDSGVMIRFIEKENDKFFFRSGGGITTQSVCEAEYQEVIDKIYVPVN